MLITYKKDEEKVSSYILDESQPFTIIFQNEVSMKNEEVGNIVANKIVVDCTALNEENERLKAENKELEHDKIAIAVCGFLACVLCVLVWFILK